MTIAIAVHQGDLTEFHADVIVNPANSTLFGGDGIDGAIHRAGGPIIVTETQRIRESTLTDGLPAGEAVSTNAGNLPAKWIVHTVSPVWDATDDHSRALESCYRQSMELANKLGAHTIAFPVLGDGIYGWPLADAARIAVATVKSTDTKLTHATFVVDSAEAFAAFAAQL